MRGTMRGRGGSDRGATTTTTISASPTRGNMSTRII
jgi:hypothetical protein